MMEKETKIRYLINARANPRMNTVCYGVEVCLSKKINNDYLVEKKKDTQTNFMSITEQGYSDKQCY